MVNVRVLLISRCGVTKRFLRLYGMIYLGCDELFSICENGDESSVVNDSETRDKKINVFGDVLKRKEGKLFYLIIKSSNFSQFHYVPGSRLF